MNQNNPPNRQDTGEDAIDDWIMLESPPSLVDSNGSSGDSPSDPHLHQLQPPEQQCEKLTKDNVQLLNMLNNEGIVNVTERIWMRQSCESLEALNGTATQGSNDGITLGDSWVPIAWSPELEICGVGSWADQPQPAKLSSFE